MSRGNKSSDKTIELSVQDKNINAIRASLKAIPIIGTPLEQLFYGKLDHLRWLRFEQTLKEISDQLKSSDIPESKKNKGDR